ncbi:MAG: hypothetical protein M3Y12_14015 [Bacteroidota bacterium]|nr:hypothetical protein [Bacteroidota bacterium]
MLTSLRGVYENGTVRFTEPLPATETPIEVVVVFLDSQGQGAASATSLARPTDPLARLRASWQQAQEITAGMTGPPLSEEVVAERQEGN